MKEKQTKAEPKMMGRPKKYHDPKFAEKEAKALLEWMTEGKGYYLGNFCVKRGYSRSRLPDMVKVSETFEDALELAKAWQEARFIENGLTKKWDPGFTRFVMARVCDPIWKASWDKEEESTDDRPINVVIRRFGDGAKKGEEDGRVKPAGGSSDAAKCPTGKGKIA